MTAKNKTTKFISALLIISILAPTVLFSQPKQAEAFWGATWLTDLFTGGTLGTTGVTAGATTTQTSLSLKDVAKEIARQILMVVAKRLLQQMTKSVTNWVNSGFHGAPLFLENPKSFFQDIAKYEVKTMVDLFGYDSNRFPFGKDFALNTINAYKRQLTDNAQYTLSKVMADPVLLHNYQNNFNVGGWNGFLINTQYPQNNYLGFQMLATEALARKVQGTSQNAAQKVQTTLQQGMGFLSPQTCPSNLNYNNGTNEFQKPSFDMDKYQKDHPYDVGSAPGVENCTSCTGAQQVAMDAYREKWNSDLANAKGVWAMTNTCPDGLVNTTPGSVVANQITTALNIPMNSTLQAMGLGTSIAAILDSLLNKFIGSGLNALASTLNPTPPVDDWTYNGETLGGPGDGTNIPWDAGPDEVVVLSDFKQTVEDGIANTNTELLLMYKEGPINPGISQVMGAIWPKSRDLDMCQPGPDLGWQDRLLAEMARNSKKLQEKANDDDGEKAAAADLVLKELKFAVNFFGDWINNNMMADLPNSVIYMDAVDEINTLAQQSDELTDKRRTKNQALARLKSIKTALTAFTTQPAAGSAQEKAMLSLYKQYKATSDAVSSTTSIEDSRNELSVAKEKLTNLDKLLTQCKAERTARGWSLPGGPTSTIGGVTEKEVYCDNPIKGGYDHETFLHSNDTSIPILGWGIGGGGVTHPEIPYVNANKVYEWRSTLGTIFTLGLGGHHQVNIQLKCNIIWKANILDYKGNLPGTTTIIEPYVTLPPDPGTGLGVCSVYDPTTATTTSDSNMTQQDCTTVGGTWVPDP